MLPPLITSTLSWIVILYPFPRIHTCIHNHRLLETQKINEIYEIIYEINLQIILDYHYLLLLIVQWHQRLLFLFHVLWSLSRAQYEAKGKGIAPYVGKAHTTPLVDHVQSIQTQVRYSTVRYSLLGQVAGTVRSVGRVTTYPGSIPYVLIFLLTHSIIFIDSHNSDTIKLLVLHRLFFIQLAVDAKQTMALAQQQSRQVIGGSLFFYL